MEPPMSVLPIIFTGFVAILLTICFLLLLSNLYEHCKSKQKETKTVVAFTFSCMLLFTLSLLFGTIKYVLLIIISKDIHIITICMYVFYGAGLMTMMYVWVERIRVTFQNSCHAYAPSTIRNLRVLYFVTAFTCFQCFFMYTIVHVFHFTHFLFWISSAIFAVSFMILSTILVYCFLQKLAEAITTAKLVSATVAKKITIGQHLVVIHAKLSILSTISIASTFCSLLGVIALDVLLPTNSHLYHFIWLLPVFCDNMIVFITLFCTLTPNKKYYFALFGCLHSMVMKKRNAMFGTQTLLKQAQIIASTTANIHSTTVNVPTLKLNAFSTQSTTVHSCEVEIVESAPAQKEHVADTTPEPEAKDIEIQPQCIISDTL